MTSALPAQSDWVENRNDCYGKEYCETHWTSHARVDSHWTSLFDQIAESIERRLDAGGVLDAPCAIGILVEALRKRGIAPFDRPTLPDLWGSCGRGSLADRIARPIGPTIEPMAEPARAIFNTPGFVPRVMLSARLSDCAAGLIALRLRLAEKDRSFHQIGETLAVDETWALAAQRKAHEAGLAEAAQALEAQRQAHEATMHERDRLVGQAQAEVAARDWNAAGLERSLKRTTAELAALRTELDRNHAELAITRHALAEATATVRHHEAMVNSTVWRITGPWRSLGNRLPRMVRDNARLAVRVAYWVLTPWKMPARVRFFRQQRSQSSMSLTAPKIDDAALPHNATVGPGSLHPPEGVITYDQWVLLYDTLSDEDCRKIDAHIASLASKPKISVIMPVFNTPETLLRDAIDSVRKQRYPHWELCIADDASTAPHVRDVLQSYAADDRIKVLYRPQNGHISASSNSALQLATGDFIALMDHDDLIPQHALYEIAAEINAHPAVDLIYTDEDIIDRGRRSNPYFKTDWNPDLILAQNCVSHFGVYRRSIVERIGGFRLGFEGSQDHDLALRFADETAAERIRHIPAVLYHWRKNDVQGSFSETALESCIGAGRRAISGHLARHGEAGTALSHPKARGFYQVKRALPDPPPLVTLIVPTKNRADLLRNCLEGLLEGTVYPSLEVIVVDHESDEPETLALLKEVAQDRRVTILPHVGPFNYSAINNRAVRAAKGSIIGLINNDIEVMRGNWLTEMVSHAVLPGVGAVGARLLYRDGRIQHGGVVLGVGGIANHFSHLTASGAPGYFGRALLTSTVSAVTGACLIVKRSAFDEVGGLDEVDLPVAFNDVDFCLKLREAGYRNIYVPAAELYHLESASRGSDSDPKNAPRAEREAAHMLERWGPLLERDPFYNPNLSLRDASWSFASPPRRVKPWMARETEPDR